MTHCSETEIFWGGLNGKVEAPGILVICPVVKNHYYHTKIDFLPQISKFLGQKNTFLFQAANWSLSGQFFQHRKVPCWLPDVRMPKVLLHTPQKMDLGPKLAILANYWHF